jgi:membrane-associated phospholipid phosphatase
MTRRRISDAARLLVGISGLAVTASLAREAEPTEEEVGLFRNAQALVPEAAFPAVWAAMQYGTFGTVPALAGLAYRSGRRRLALGIAAAGTAAWVGAKGVKRVIGRGRPADLLRDVLLRGKEEGGLGFPSGHAAVSTAMTTVLAPHLGTVGTACAVGLTAHVGWARMYVGAHMPLDVLGGTAMGLAIGGAVNLAVGVEDEARS